MPSRLDLGGFVQAGGEAERYLRVLQVAGRAPLVSFTIQPFTRRQTEQLHASGADPWSARFGDANGEHAAVQALRPKARLILNSSFPFQDGGGPTWAGRGATAEAQLGLAAASNLVSAQLAPVAFVAQNASFALAPNGAAGDRRFRDARQPDAIDLPQRFGASAYSRLDLGTSAIAVEPGPFAAVLSTAPMRWGPQQEFPLVLGPNAGGFPSLYVGTSSPVDLWLFQIHGRVLYGELGESAFSPAPSPEGRRFASGMVVTVMPRWTPGLELGGTRFIHTAWSNAGSVAHRLAEPFTGILQGGLAGAAVADEKNQVASAFGRWVFPAAKTELYGEFYKEDAISRLHEGVSLVEEPDDYSAFAIGLQRVLTATDARIRVFRAELVNGETSHQQRGDRGFTVPLPPYVNGGVQQGHTVNGLLLGAPDAYGGSGWRIGMDEFTTAGRRSLTFERSLRFDWLPTLGNTTLVHPDVIYDVRVELLRFRGAREYALTIVPAIDLNRNLVAHNDVWNLMVALTTRGW